MSSLNWTAELQALTRAYRAACMSIDDINGVGETCLHFLCIDAMVVSRTGLTTCIHCTITHHANFETNILFIINVRLLNILQTCGLIKPTCTKISLVTIAFTLITSTSILNRLRSVNYFKLNKPTWTKQHPCVSKMTPMFCQSKY